MIVLIQVFLTVQIPPRRDEQPPEQPRQQAVPVHNPLQPVCPACGWSRPYDNLRSARNGLAGHKQHCPGAERRVSEFSRPFIARKS